MKVAKEEMYSSTADVKTPLKQDLPYRSAKPPAGVDIEPKPLQGKKQS